MLKSWRLHLPGEATETQSMLKLINRLEEGLMALFLAVMTFLTATQVVLRYVFS